MPDEHGQRYKRSYVAAAVASVSAVVAAVVGYLTNVLTSSWSWALFAALAVLVTVTAVLPFAAEKIEGQRQRQAEELRLRAERQAVIAGRERERMAALRGHFQSRAQGLTPSWSRREWYFTGRERVLSEIVDWISAWDLDFRARIITGGPGSGKSTVLGRIVTLGHPALRDGVPAQELARTGPGTIPPAGSIYSAVSAQGRSVDQVAAAIGDDLGLTAGTAGELLADLPDRRDEPVVIVVDAVDEAAEPGRLIYELLAPIAFSSGRTGVRLLAGMRPGLNRHLVRQFGPTAVELDLDSDAYWDQRDVAAYVSRCLLAEEEKDLPTPYRGQVELARRVADAVASSAGRSFLIAQLTGFALAATPAVTDTQLTSGQRRFPDNVGAAMDEYLARFAADRRKVRDLLLPLAWAEGDGLADRLAWARLATELGTGSYIEQDITWLLRDTNAVDLLQRIERDDGTWYRLFHAALSEHLRALSEAERPGADIQRRFAAVLIDLVPRDEQGLNWLNADNYTKAYLATHAAAGGALDGLVLDARFLVAAGPERLLPALRACHSGRAQAVAAVVERIGSPFLRSSAAERASYLEMSARKHGENELADTIAALPLQRPWSAPWTHWAEWDRLAHGRTLGQHPDYVIDVAVASVHGQLCVVSASKWAIQTRRLADAEPAGPEIRDWASPIEAMAIAAGPEPVIVTKHQNGQIHHWDLTTGALPDDDTEPGNDSWSGSELSSVTRYRDRDLIVTRSGESVQLRDVVTGEQVGGSLIVAGLERILTVKVIGDRLLILAEVNDWHIGVWDLLARSLIAEPFAPFGTKDVNERYSCTWSGDLAGYDGRVIAVLGGGVRWPVKSQIVVWDVVSGKAIGGDLTGHRYGVMAMKVESIDTQQIICTGGGDGTVRCWLWPQGDLNGEPIFAHAGGVDCIATTRTDGQLTVISGGRDGAVRSWDLGSIRSAKPYSDASVWGLVCSSPDGQPIVTGITGGQSLTTWNCATGQKIIEWAAGSALTLAVGVDLPGHSLIATDDDPDIQLWNPTSGQLEMSLHLPEGTRITDLVAWNADGRSILAVGSAEGRVHVWDVLAQTPLYAPIASGSTSPLLAIESVDDVPHIVTISHSDTRPRLWDLATGEASSTAFQPRQSEEPGGISGLAVGNIDGKTVAICVCTGARCYAWDLHDGTLLLDMELEGGHGMALWAVTIGELKGRHVIVSSGYAGVVTLWKLDGSIAQTIETGSPVPALVIDGRKRIICGGFMGILATEIS